MKDLLSHMYGLPKRDELKDSKVSF